MKNAFNFTLKAHCVLKIFKLLSIWSNCQIADNLVMQKNGLIRKIRLISKFMTSQLVKQTIAMHILPNISRSKGNQITKFGQLIDIIWEKFFLKNHTQNVVAKLYPDFFLKYQNWAYLWNNSLKLGIVCQVQDYQNILKLSRRYLLLPHINLLKKQKKVWK